MGLVSSLALSLIPLARRWSSPPAKIPIEVSSELSEARRELGEARAEAKRWEALAKRWEARYDEAMNPHLEHNLTMQQYHAQMAASQAMLENSYYNRGLLGGPGLQQGAFPGDCACTPGRAALLTR